MSIVCLILKIIGILLLTVLCLILLVLFHPVFYQAKGEAEENKFVQGYFWWLFQILRLEFRWEGQEVNIRLRIFGFTRNLGEEKTKDGYDESGIEEYRTEEPEEEEQKRMKAEPEAEGQRCLTAESAAEKTGKFAAGEKAENGFQKEDDLLKNSALSKSFGSPKKKKQKKKTEQKEEKRETGSGILDRLKDIRKEASDERNRKAISHLWRELCYLLAHLKPKYVKAKISFSTGDPALTGEVTGVMSLFPLLYRYDAHVYPDFLSEEFYIRGSLQIKGHIAVIHFLIILIRLFLDQNIKRLHNTLRSRF